MCLGRESEVLCPHTERFPGAFEKGEDGDVFDKGTGLNDCKVTRILSLFETVSNLTEVKILCTTLFLKRSIRDEETT